MRPRPQFLAVLAIASFLATGCGAAALPTATPEPLQIRFAYPLELQTAYYERLAAEFEAANPGVDVLLLEGNPYNALASPTSPADAAEVDQLAVAMLADSELLRPLEPLLQVSTDFDLGAFYEGTVQSLRYRGQLWGLPSDVDPWVLYFNKDLFDARGVAYPANDWTWDDLQAAAEQLADPTAEPSVYGLLTDVGRADFVPFVYQNGGSLVDSLVEPKAVTFTDLPTIEAVEWYAGLALNLAVAPTPTQLQSLGGFEAAVLGRRGAMWYGALSERGGLSWGSDWPFAWGAVAPAGNRARMTLLSMRAYVLGAKAEQTGPAWEWLRYLVLHPSTTFDLPPLKEASNSGALRSALGEEVYAAAQEALSIGHTIPLTPWIADVGAWLGQAMQSVFDERMTVEAALAVAQERADALLAEQGSE